MHNTAALGQLIYDDYILLFQLAGLILLVAMIGAIVLTLRHRTDIKRQDILAQMYRDPAKAMEAEGRETGAGAVNQLAPLMPLADAGLAGGGLHPPPAREEEKTRGTTWSDLNIT